MADNIDPRYSSKSDEELHALEQDRNLPIDEWMAVEAERGRREKSRQPTRPIDHHDDGAGWHQTEFKLPDNLKLHFLPPYSPELKLQEHIWDELREKWFHNIVFDSLDALEDQLVAGLKALETNPAVVKFIVGWDWIINCISSRN